MRGGGGNSQRAGEFCQVGLSNITPIPSTQALGSPSPGVCTPGEEAQGLLKPGRLGLVSVGAIATSLLNCYPSKPLVLLHASVLTQ